MTRQQADMKERMRDPLRRACCLLLWRAPMLLPLLTVAGTICGLEGPGAWGWVLAAIAPIVAQVLRMRRICICCLACAAVVLSTQLVRRESEEAVRRLCAEGQAVTMRGLIVREQGGSCVLETGWLGARVLLRGEAPRQVGDELRVVAEPLPAEEPAVAGMFSAAEWMRRSGYCASLAYLHGEKVGESYGWSRLVRYAGSVRRALADRLMPPGTESDVNRQVLCALVLGEKERSASDTIELFRRGGCLHIFAVSGLHVGVVAGILWALLRLCRVTPRVGRYVLLVGVGLYVASTGLAVSALRAYLMLAAAVGGLILKRRSSLFNAWCFVAVLILLVEPRQLYQPGFQLSFAVYAAICIGVHFSMADSPWFGPDAYLPARLYSRYDRLRVWADYAVRGAVIVSLSAWLVSLPLALAHFHAVSTVSYLTNLALTPLLPVVMLLGLAALACGQLPLLGSASQYLALKGAGCLVSLVSLGGQYTGSFVPGCVPAAADSAMLVGLSYGRSCCVLGNPGVLIGDVQRETDARYSVEPALFHAGYTPELIWAGGGEPAALQIYRRSWPKLKQVQPGARSRRYSGPSGEYCFYFPPPELPLSPAANAQPIILWVRPDGVRVLYIGHAAMSTLESMPPEERRADIIILGSNPREPLLDASVLHAMGPGKIILLPAVRQWAIPDHELAPIRVERLSAEEQPILQL